MDCLLIMLRSANSPGARPAISRFMHTRFLGPLAAFVGGLDAMTRARALGAVMMGGSISLMFPDANDMSAEERVSLRDRIVSLLRCAGAA